MANEKRIVASCLKSRQAFSRIYPFLSESSCTVYSWYILGLCKDFYARDKDAKEVDKEFLSEKILLDFPSPKKAEIYANHALECYGMDISALDTAELILEAKRKEGAQELAQALISAEPDSEELLSKIASYKDLLTTSTIAEDGDDPEVFHDVSVDEINATVLDPKGRIKILSKQLTELLSGGALGGNVIWVFGRPEIGKSAVAITCASVFSMQGLPGIFFENEDPIRATIERVQACSTRSDSATRVKDPREAQRRLNESGYKNIRFINIAPGSVGEIERYCEEYKPRWIIVNQIRNLRTRAENRTNQLENIATDLRALAKRHNILLIGVTQAGDSATNKLVLDIGDVDGSNTGIPAQADVMIGVGANTEFINSGMRMISLPKNKLSGKHVHFQMKIIPELSRMEDL